MHENDDRANSPVLNPSGKAAPMNAPAAEHPMKSEKGTSTVKAMPVITSPLRGLGKLFTRLFRAVTSDFWTKSIGVLGLIFLAALCALVVALLLRVASPKSQITVSAFELFVDDQKSGSLSGKALADLIVDNL